MSGSRLVSSQAARRFVQVQSRQLSSLSTQPYRSRGVRRTKEVPAQLQALAILLPKRGYATETSTHGTDSGPPPGFNINEAKKPLPKEEQKQASQTPTVAGLRKGDEQTETPKDEATMVDKTPARESATLSDLAASKAAHEKNKAALKKEEKKLTLGQKIKKEVQHYWDGTKLLATEVRISSRLALKMAAGYEMSRRENRQLQRTVQDLGRLVPFSVFVIVPFAELLLPVALKLFPNMLPSTYEGQTSREAKASRLRTTRKNVSSFLRETLRETGLPVSAKTAKKEEFIEFFRKVRSTGEAPTKDDTIKACRMFKDDLTLDNLSRPQLVGICKYMNLNTFGTDAMLRYQIRHRMRQIKRDDKAISFEGVDSLSVPELQMACASRGLRTHGMSPGKLREDLQMWLDLRLKYNIPSTLLVLSNAYMYTSGKDKEIDTQIEALQAVLSSIPEELFHEIELEVHNAEGAATNRQRLEVLKEQQELIEEENEQAEENKEANPDKEASSPKDDKDIDEKPKKKVDAEASPAESEAAEAEKDAEEQGRQEKPRKEEEVKKD
ncbi:LETM1 domain-containing protein ylh47 [Exophiala xenobiotica]|uniref:LETM1 domain-containing protein ylh47 n=1 Tax=Lithohypha guttulata TaxID=1690604 RepID=A0ABR0JXM4_9EURO|nr:LETM1 domain-containing protein ylh47 [Lithohypha guttulata]KAK5310466.1 LETM1 domain-containing protein ylh47 [Exophiala xenobiotica]